MRSHCQLESKQLHWHKRVVMVSWIPASPGQVVHIKCRGEYTNPRAMQLIDWFHIWVIFFWINYSFMVNARRFCLEIPFNAVIKVAPTATLNKFRLFVASNFRFCMSWCSKKHHIRPFWWVKYNIFGIKLMAIKFAIQWCHFKEPLTRHIKAPRSWTWKIKKSEKKCSIKNEHQYQNTLGSCFKPSPL